VPARDPEVAAAIPNLVEQGVVADALATRILAVAGGERVSARAELRWGMGLGVTLATAGLGLGVKENLDALGPWGVALLLALGAAACFAFVLRRAPGFTWGRSTGGDWIDDGLILLGLGFTGALLVWIEIRLAALGDAWPWHLLLISLIAAAAALRFDSRVAWSLALSSFAAWRGVALATVAGRLLLAGSGATLRANALGVAVLFAGLGAALRRFDRKAHFEPATTFLAAALALGALFAGMISEPDASLGWALALALVGAGVVAIGLRLRRFGLFALAVLALYAAITRLAYAVLGETLFAALGCLWIMGSAVGMVVLLVWAQRRFRRESAS
jgi:hypothetical protein